jgi:hypothetical protein
MTLRSRGELAGLLADLDPGPPGLVPVTEWRPEPADPASSTPSRSTAR